MYHPQKIANQHFPLQNETVGMIYNAERDILRLDARIKHSPYTTAIRKTLVRGDGLGVLNIKSAYPDLYTVMRIEAAAYLLGAHQDTNETLRGLLVNETHPALDEAIEVYRFMQATEWITDAQSAHTFSTPEDLINIYTRCEIGPLKQDAAFSLRTNPLPFEGDQDSPGSYFPPDPEEIETLLYDLCVFANANTLSPLAQAGIAQFQFEAIKPFDSNLDRMERLMMDYIFRNRKFTESITFPLNFFAAHTKDQFYDLLMPYLGETDIDETGTLPYVEKLIMYTTNASYELLQFIVTLHKILSALIDQWRARLGRVEKGSALELLLFELVGTPVLTISQARSLINKSFSTTSEAFERLETAGILRAGKPIRRNKTFEATEAIFLHDSMYRKYLPSTNQLRALNTKKPNAKRSEKQQ